MRETIDKLLKDYVADEGGLIKEPQKVYQIEGWYGGKWQGDPIVSTDEKGYSMLSTGTIEWMDGADVRILIADSTPVSEAAALLRQAADWLDREPNHGPGSA